MENFPIEQVPQEHPPQEQPQPSTAEPAPSPAAQASVASRPTQDWLGPQQPVFVIEDSFYRSRTPPRPVHWSIAWSDLMMTMFILFLTLFVHLRTHQPINAHGTPNKVADEAIPVHAETSSSSLVFHPISQDVSLKIANDLQPAKPPNTEQSGADILIRHRTVEQPSPVESSQEPANPQVPAPPIPEVALQPPAHVLQAASTPPQPEPTPTQDEVNSAIYDLSKQTVAREKLERFASVELVPDKTVRLILTGDLLFASGQAELSPSSIHSLRALVDIIKKTPYMINVIGHTDDRPVSTSRFPSNWELSLARASRVARFLIDETKLPASQFSVSGFSSFRPVKPNSNDENRKTNRRVEIILSKELPQPQTATPANLKESDHRQ